MEPIQQNIEQVRSRIQSAVSNSGRTDEVILLAVSKTKPASLIREAWECGQRHFGENYLQEGVEKVTTLEDLSDIVWHFIGPLQSNKTRSVAEHFHWVHSVDRLKIARRLSDQRPEHLPPLNICLQVNISNEASKSGLLPEEVPVIAAEVMQLPNVQLRGLMAIPQPCDDPEQQRLPFCKMAQLLTQLQQQFPDRPLDTLSMGMSGDLEAAIMEGSTMVRVGTALFGARSYSNSDLNS
ncbi:YggS family pyridoxal phosphate-dependent enzyme [Spongorhabdus nitratireducens]